ncbi:MAG: hypothetical protein ACLFTA_03005 [Candidatus Nanohaloarchaea archaeon]
MILLGSYTAFLLSIMAAFLTAYLYRKEDGRFRYSGAAALTFAVLGLAGVASVMAALT